MLFRSYIEKFLELRITIVGKKIFCCSIDSQKKESTKIDWRKLDLHDLKHEIYTLPENISQKLIKLIRKMNLIYSAIDMILTPQGDYVFLEVNPSGQYEWIEKMTGLEITKSIAEHLIKGHI